LLLASVPDPEAVQRYLERLLTEAPSAFDRVTASAAALRCAVNIFSYSRFLSDAVLKRPERILEVSNSGSFYRVLSCEEYEERLFDFLGKERRDMPSALDLARFRRRQLLRISLRDVMCVAGLAEVTEELSNLADAILDFTYRRIRARLVAQHGEPRLADGSVCGFSVISLGKLGGKELNYSSDIDLMFVYSGNGETDGPTRISNKEFCKKIANEYTALLSTYTADGLCYRVDLRLRPDGTLGEICISDEGARQYYVERARDWEKQMLIKARISAGESEPGAGLLEFVEPLIYQTSLDFRAVEAVSETRQRISEKANAKKRAKRGLDIKLTPGGIRDIEFLVQCLQRLHGGREPWVRHGGTMFALFRLRDKRLLSDTEYGRLAAAYQFLRYVEHRLQLDEDQQTHTLPPDGEALDLLARKMPPEGNGDPRNGETFKRGLNEHLACVLEIYDRVIHAQKPLYYSPAPPPQEPLEEPEPAPAATNLNRLLDQRAPSLAAIVAGSGLNRGRMRFDHFLEKAFANPAMLDRLDCDPKLSAAVLDIFEHSPYFADELLRQPDLLEEIGSPPLETSEPMDDGSALRRFYRRQMMRIQSESILAAAPIFSSLRKTSALADRVIQASYRIAVLDSLPPSSLDYNPQDQMMVISLGRLGMNEFDLGSDADLIFVLPDADAAELPFWTGVAERMIHTMSSYTGEGVMFTIDTRLRPNGREGDLVQLECAYKNYFEHGAEAWEGITYMKSRAVAGNVERATEFLHELQEVDWRRYGQSMRSRKDLSAMRARLEREQGPRNPLKAGIGGYYDIDFALMYLRLKGAGIFYKALNTPERIDVIEKMGHLEREDADFLREAATFYRALDHGQRVSTGHAEGSLPKAQAQFEVLTSLVKRWTPEHLHGQRIDATLREIRGRTRDYFQRLFGK
jgi:[glutamine synthetase] adenylyltransferase / [glutamine synthetase]-adenylyl-L-tyrosine phosphorylase